MCRQNELIALLEKDPNFSSNEQRLIMLLSAQYLALNVFDLAREKDYKMLDAQKGDLKFRLCIWK